MNDNDMIWTNEWMNKLMNERMKSRLEWTKYE